MECRCHPYVHRESTDSLIHSTVSSKLLGIGIRNKNVFVEIFLGRWHTKFGSLMFTNIKVMRTTSAWEFFLQRAVISHTYVHQPEGN